MDKAELAEDLAANGLTAIKRTSNWAERELSDRGKRSLGSGFVSNSLNDTKALGQRAKRARSDNADLHRMKSAPLYARVRYSVENHQPGCDGEIIKTVYIVRGQTPSENLGFSTASANSPVGKMASYQPGDGCELTVKGRTTDALLVEVTRLRPARDNLAGYWDSLNTQVRSEDAGTFTIPSLREYLSDNDDPWGVDETDLIEGLIREKVTGFGLRDQIVDRVQLGIADMPLSSQCLVTGPPGTGKTTTLIRRIGLMTDMEFMDEPTRELAQSMELDLGIPHADSWILFSPSELLQQYVKEALIRENLSASQKRVTTWKSYRQRISRDNLALLKSASRRTGFVLNGSERHLGPGARQLTDWYEDFAQYRNERDQRSLLKAADLLSGSSDDRTREVSLKLRAAFEASQTDGERVRAIGNTVDALEILLGEKDRKVITLIGDRLSLAVNADRDFPVKLRDEIMRIRDTSSEDPDEVMDLTESEESENEAREPTIISRKQARGRTIRFIRTQAFNLSKGSRPKPDSAASRILAWLGEARAPTAEDMTIIGSLEREIRAIRFLLRYDMGGIRRIVAAYRQYRRERSRDGVYYVDLPENASHIHETELDMLLLAALQELSRRDRGTGHLSPERRAIMRAQVFVDEATDFSPIQLASILELAHPGAQALFMAGDLNQRLSETGIQSSEALEWVKSGFKTHHLAKSYRHTQALLDLANAIAELGVMGDAQAIHSEYEDRDAPKPEWCAGLGTTDDIARWLAGRIAFVDKVSQSSGRASDVVSIAIVATDETQARQLTEALGPLIGELGRVVTNRATGQSVGEAQDVSVYCQEHIKGLEFEAVFFLDVDKLIAEMGKDALTHIYVGATRAANYLGMTFSDSVPEAISSLMPYFDEVSLNAT